MKKYFLYFTAVVTMISMIFTTSCQRVENPSAIGVESEVTFSVSTPDIQTRAYSDGTTANKLTVAVYNGESLLFTENKDMTGTHANVTLTLVNGMNYNIVFWAQAAGAPYHFDTDKRTMTVDYNGVHANDENLDAFWKKIEYKSEGAKTQKVELTRPFAQLNIAASDWDEALNLSKVEVKHSEVKVEKVYSKMDMFTGAVAEESEVAVEFGMNTTPNSAGQELRGYTIADGYRWLAMNYLLVNEQELVVVTFNTDCPSYVSEKVYRDIPVKRNYRTNIYGRILTSDTEFDVETKPGFDGDGPIEVPYASINGKIYQSFEEAFQAVEDGQTIKLGGETIMNFGPQVRSTEIPPYLYLVDGKSVTIDLNGYAIKASIPDVTSNTFIFQVQNGGTLTIEGEGKIHINTAKATDRAAGFINNLGGEVNLKGGEWTIDALEYPDALIPTFVDNNSNVSDVVLNIYDGTYTFHRNLFRNFANAASHNNYATVATMNIYGGTFNGREGDAGAIWNQKPSATVPAGAGVINVMGGTFNNVVIDDDFAGVVNATTQQELEAALSNVNTHTIMLGAGEFVADIYNGTPGRNSLTIIGSEGTKFGHTATTGGQLRLDLFESFTIKNCEIIQRSGVRTWGHIVFGSGNKADGVYTIENCTFNGVGTQGIYINETVSGATYNILNCTFNGDFGSEGAITIQTNKDVNHTINIKGCEFNNIPETSHRIFLAPWDGKDSFYYGWTLNTDLKASSNAEIVDFINMGVESINLSAGNYDMPTSFGMGVNLQGKNLTIKGTKETVIDVSEVDERDQFVTGANLAFEGVTLNFGTKNYMGFANYASLTYKNCTINGLQFAYGAGQTVFENCDLNSNGAEHSLWTWGGQNISFTNCDFTYGDRAVNCYGEGVTTNISFTNCNFTKVAGKPTTGAIETNSSTLTALYLTINNCTVNEGDLWWISEWDSMGGANTSATVDGKIATNAAISAAINNGATTINLLKGEYIIPSAAQGKTLTFVGLEDNPDAVKVGVTKGGEGCDYGLDGSTVTFENITITTNSSNYIGYARCKGTYKNCVINGTYTLYDNSIFENCTFNVSGDVYNIWTWGAPTATFTGCTFNSDGKAMLLYGTADTKLTVNNCTFNDNGGLTDKKAAIETGNDYNKSYELIVNNTTVNGYEINDKGISTGTTLWANKNSMGKDKLNVVVDGIDVY